MMKKTRGNLKWKDGTVTFEPSDEGRIILCGSKGIEQMNEIFKIYFDNKYAKTYQTDNPKITVTKTNSANKKSKRSKKER